MEEIRVKVLETGLKETKLHFGLDDSTGHMLRMQGKIFPITGVQSGASSIRIFCIEADRSFTFASKDYKILNMNEKSHQKLFPKRKPETFDPKQLDI